MNDATAMLLAFALLQAADIWTTRVVLSLGGRELNPLMARLFRRFGFWPAVLWTKGAALALVWYYQSELADWEFKVVVLAYVLVVANNLLAIVRMRRRGR